MARIRFGHWRQIVVVNGGVRFWVAPWVMVPECCPLAKVTED